MRPWCRTIAPISCVSNGRWPIVRTDASRTSAYASGSRLSRLSPPTARSFNLSVYARISASVSFCIFGSSALMTSTVLRRRLISASFEPDSIFLINSNMCASVCPRVSN